jgi:hypothetical protein
MILETHTGINPKSGRGKLDQNTLNNIATNVQKSLNSPYLGRGGGKNPFFKSNISNNINIQGKPPSAAKPQPKVLAKPQTQLPNQISTPAPNTQGQLNNIPSGVTSTPTSVSSASPQPANIQKILANLGAGGSGQKTNQFSMPKLNGIKFGGT